MKRLYTFTLDKEVDTEEVIKNEDGTKTVKPVRKNVPQTFFLRKPKRSDFDECELYYNIQLSEFVRAGCMTHALLNKRIANDGGAMSEKEKEEYTKSYTELFKKQGEYQRIIATKKEEDRTEDEKKQIRDLMNELAELTVNIQKMEYGQISLFDHTAENLARNRVIRRWILLLLYTEQDGKETPYFGNGTFEERLAKFDELEENATDFESNLIKKVIYAISFWWAGRASTQEEFEHLQIDSLEEKPD